MTFIPSQNLYPHKLNWPEDCENEGKLMNYVFVFNSNVSVGSDVLGGNNIDGSLNIILTC